MEDIKNSLKQLSVFLNIWVIGGAILFAIFLTVLSLFGLWIARAKTPSIGAATAIIHVIPIPTFSPSPPALATKTQEFLGDSQIPSPPPEGTIFIGAYVQITGTGGDGLRLRAEPGINSQVRLLGDEAEIFRVEDGPVELNGFTWWYLVGPFDKTRFGWAVSNYLTVVPGP